MARYRAGLGMRHVAVVAAAGLFTAACGGTIPPDGSDAMLTTPSAAVLAAGAGVTGDGSRTVTRDVAMFTLANGTFKFTSRRGELAGTYVGLVTAPTPGRSTVAMTLQVTRGSDELAGATGTLVGEGSGGFTTGGDFKLKLTGDVRTSAEPWGTTVHATVAGEATLPTTCSANNRRILRLRGEGAIPTMGRFAMEFDSEILETNCF